jgi:hypothetical protein
MYKKKNKERENKMLFDILSFVISFLSFSIYNHFQVFFFAPVNKRKKNISMTQQKKNNEYLTNEVRVFYICRREKK